MTLFKFSPYVFSVLYDFLMVIREKVYIIPDHVVSCQQWLEVMAAVSYPSRCLLCPHCLQVKALPSMQGRYGHVRADLAKDV